MRDIQIIVVKLEDEYENEMPTGSIVWLTAVAQFAGKAVLFPRFV